MLKRSCFLLTLCLFGSVLAANGQLQNSPQVYGTTLQARDDIRAHTNYRRWQVWLYQDVVRIPQYAPGLQYSSWGLMEGGSAESVMKQLRDVQRFEEAYLSFFGPDTWGRHSFSNPLGPIPVTAQEAENEPTTLGVRYQLDELQYRVNRLIADAQPSLENNKSEGPSSHHKEYFDQIRDALQQVSKLYSQLARRRHDVSFVSREIARTGKAVREATNNLGRVRASLPSVRLPTSTTWMLHTEKAGSDGTIQVEVKETGSAVSVRQTWSGGDGSMTGTVIVTTIPFDDIGRINLRPPMEKGDETWTVSVEAGRHFFPEAISSPLRHAPKRVLPAVDITTTRSLVWFAFGRPTEAQDAFAYFLYHKQLGR